MKLDVLITNACKHDLKKAKEQGKNLDLFFEIVDQISEGKILDKKYCDHKLKGKFEGKRECHIEPDFLLIYQIVRNDLILYLVRAGSHSSLFD